MFKIESYVTPILLSYVDKYVRDFKPADAQVSLWGGGVALHNLVLKADVLQQELSLPFTLVSGRIHELLIQVPWTKIMSEPIVVTIDTIECVLSLTRPQDTSEENLEEAATSQQKNQVIEAPPGYMQALVRRIVSNIALRVHHLIVKYVQDDIVMSLNVKHLAVDSAGVNWEPTFADIDQADPVIRRLMRLDDLTLCLDQSDSDGKIRFYQEPLLYRCQLDFRILTKLVSANTRRASSLNIQVRSSKLAWGVTGDQITMLIRLVRERTLATEVPATAPAKSADTQTAAINSQSSSAEPARSESWSEWAWSWMPTLVDRENGAGGAQSTQTPPAPVPFHATAYIEEVSFVFKVMEADHGNRKRSRGVLELIAKQTAFKSYVCNPTTIRIRAGTRSLVLLSRGKCICGHMGYDALLDEPTYFVQKRETGENDTEWMWPDDDLSHVVETAQVADEQMISSPDVVQQTSCKEAMPAMSDTGQLKEPTSIQELVKPKDDDSEFWKQMAPQLYVEFIHERSPPELMINPYENPPKDFEHSDWVEECNVRVILKPVDVRVSLGLIHRLSALGSVFKELPPVPLPDLPMRVLTVEECESLIENLPQRRFNIEVEGLRFRVRPFDHAAFERSTTAPLLLDIDLPKINIVVTGPLYPYRVCMAACQMPEDEGQLWQGARLHVTVSVRSIQARISSDGGDKTRPCARMDLTAVFHVLLNKEYFMRRESIELAYSIRICEANVCGSAARLQAAWQVLSSLMSKRFSAPLRHTTLASDALDDEDSVAVDVTFEDLMCRGFFTRNTTTHIMTLHSTKATALHELKGELKQAWLFSGPDSPTNTPYMRIAVQYCNQIKSDSIEYAGIWTEPSAVAVDPLFIAWLAYRPTLKNLESLTSAGSMKNLSSLYFMRRRTTPSSSSGRGGSKPGSGAEVHMRGRSFGSSDPAESVKRSQPKPKSPLERYWGSDKLLQFHERLQKMLVNMEIGLTLVYVNTTTASAVDYETLRDAMELHASTSQAVTVFSLGRLTMFSNTLTRQIWNDIKHDGPTFEVRSTKPLVQDSFPWKVLLADVSIYTLESAANVDKSDRDQSPGSGLRSQLRKSGIAVPKTVLELVTSSVTVTVVTKEKQIKKITKKEAAKKEKEPTPEETRMQYFTSGMDFKPSTLKEFVRGPARRTKEKSPEPANQATEDQSDEVVELTRGPVVSLGIHVHADTPPLVFRLGQNQIQVFAAAIHCLSHIQSLLQRPRLYIPKESRTTSVGGSKTFVRSGSAMEELHSPSTTTSEEKSELIPIFETQSIKAMEPVDVKTFVWFQWVVSRVTIVATTNKTKLALVVDDIISSVDLQPYYNQYKIKVASASVKHYARTGDGDWTAGVLGGRVLEAREPANAKEDNHFLACTITQAQVASLPTSWKEELHPKLLERKHSTDCMWEVYATLAPLEAVIQPKVLNQIMSLIFDLAPKSFCPLTQEKEHLPKPVQWPFCYITAGGLRLLLTVQDETRNLREEDTFMLVIGKTTVNPHPENPICRRSINPSCDTSGWITSALDGQQYELVIKNLGIRCAQFYQLVNLENSEQEMAKGTAGENPALKWTQQIVLPRITPLLHSLDVSCILAPALYINEMLTCGRALEINLISDCSLEISIEQMNLAQNIVGIMMKAYKDRTLETPIHLEQQENVCPYATLLMTPVDSRDSYSADNSTVFDPEPVDRGTETTKMPREVSESTHGADSGVYVGPRTKSRADSQFVKKSVSVAFVEPWSDSSEFLEVFVTMGTIELCLYTLDDGSPEIKTLLPPENWKKPVVSEKKVPEEAVQTVTKIEEHSAERVERVSAHLDNATMSPSLDAHSAKSLTDTARDVDVGKMKLEMPYSFPPARKGEGFVALLTVTLLQPNLYYWRKMTQKNIQVSIFDAWIGLGAGMTHDLWYSTLLSTEKGAADPVTEIPPALATMKVIAPASGSAVSSVVRGSIRLDIERPVMFEVSSDSLHRLKGIYKLAKDRMLALRAKVDVEPIVDPSDVTAEEPLLYRIRHMLVRASIENVTLQTTQVGVTGSQGAAGWDSLSVQVAAGGRPDRLVARSLVTAAVVAAGPPGDSRHIVMQPVMMGAVLQANWEAWRRVESGLSEREPTVRMCVDLDWMLLDLRPTDLNAVMRVCSVLELLTREHSERNASSLSSDSRSEAAAPTVSFPRRSSGTSTAEIPSEEHFYKDDLRGGAFKIVSGGQLPMAYQVTLHNNAVSWRYPHPRAITRLVIFPLPGEDEETPCVLELFTPLLCQWEPHTYFAVPVSEPREIQLYVPAPNAVSAQMWRFRVLEFEDKPKPFEFNIRMFMARDDPLSHEVCEERPLPAPSCGVTSEQLSGVVRVDSCFSPRLSPRLRLVARLANIVVYLHNSLPSFTGLSTNLEGYYVSKPLYRSHRVLSLRANSASLRAQLASPAGTLYLLNAHVSSDILESATGTMESLVDEFSVRSGLSLPVGLVSRARLALSHVNVVLNVPRLRTLQSLGADWRDAVDQHVFKKPEVLAETSSTSIMTYDQNQITSEALEGRVSLWIHNSCAVALRIGQEGTEEVVPMGPGARLAYRWRSPTAPKKLRFALVGPSDWSWSTSIPFTVDQFRVRLQVPDPEGLGSCSPAPVGGAFLYTSVEEKGARLCMRLAGRLCLANMLRFHLLYKVRARCSETLQWRTVCSSELQSETVGRTVVCGADCEMSFKIKFTTNDTGWSGDIPLKECPKENVPWLVKVPCEGDLPYMCVWTRVVRSRTDGRIMATVWPLYTLYSHLSLDTDVLVVTETIPNSEPLPPLIQPAPGRGASTHLLTPGTTSARHNLSFQYRNLECPVTKDAVPLHYGMTSTSVFDKRTPTTTLETVFKETMRWLGRSRRFAVSEWPYSIVAKHWPGKWTPALLQPRSDVIVQYCAIRAGGGCSLEIQLRPVVILCNAAPIPLTLRAHDAAPLCRLEPGTAISPPSTMLTKSFFISVEIGRETFVSGELSVTSDELGVYGTPAPGRIALNLPTEMAIQCNHKVALLTMYYEIKKDINVLGMTSTYLLINRLKTDILITAMAVPNEDDERVILRPATYKVVEPTEPDSVYGTSVCKFWVTGRMWRGSNPAELRLFLCISLPNAPKHARSVPVRLGQPPFRRSVALIDESDLSVPVVVTQMKHEGRWIVTVSPDPCPQLVVYNGTRGSIAIAQPIHSDEPSNSKTRVRVECSGTEWYCTIRPGAAMFYSTPSYCLRYPPPAVPAVPTVPFLTFAKTQEVGEPDWCAPVALTDGEQLIQLNNDDTVKMRLRTHPHSTVLELRDVDHHDISASDIRRRLMGAFSSDEFTDDLPPKKDSMPHNLERIDAEDQLLASSVDETSMVSSQFQSLSVTTEIPAGKEEHVAYAATQDVPVMSAAEKETSHPSTVLLFSTGVDVDLEQVSKAGVGRMDSIDSLDASHIFPNVYDNGWNDTAGWRSCDRLRLFASTVGIQLSGLTHSRPLIAVHLDRPAVVIKTHSKQMKTTVSIANIQLDNLQFETGQYDFAVVASTCNVSLPEIEWPPLWTLFGEMRSFATRHTEARFLLRLTHDSWTAQHVTYRELSEVEARLGPLALYIEDAYVTALVSLMRGAVRMQPTDLLLVEEQVLRAPLRLRSLHLHPLDLTLTLHTAVRMYIALDHSPLRLSAFKLTDVMTSSERLTHALTVHYLSAAILGAGWVVGGLELLGAPGALAARVGGATGGVRGVASAAAAALLRSLSAWAGSLARNLDLLAGDEEHAKRAAMARRRAPQSFMAGLAAGITNFAINILGAVGGLAHHPLVGVAVGESESGATALRRGLIGALTKPLSATADLVAYAGHGLLTQTGWDPIPHPHTSWNSMQCQEEGWRRDCVRWAFRLADLPALSGFRVLLEGAPLHLLVTHKFLVLASPDSERITEMIDFRFCTVGPYRGEIIQLIVTQRRAARNFDGRSTTDEDNVQISAAAMARVARYTGMESTDTSAAVARGMPGAAAGETRVLALLPAPGRALSLYAALVSAARHNSDVYFPLL